MTIINRTKLAKLLSREMNLSHKKCDLILRRLIKGITTLLKDGNKVKLNDLGTFEVVDRKARYCAHPQKPTEKILVSATKIIKFRPSYTIKKIMRKN